MRPRTYVRCDQQNQGVPHIQLPQLVGSLSTPVGKFKIKSRIFLYVLGWRKANKRKPSAKD